MDVFILQTEEEKALLDNLTIRALQNITSGMFNKFITLHPNRTQSIDLFSRIKKGEVQFFQNWTELALPQVEGLQSMCRHIRGNAPYVLQGGPGTGKTRIICFAIAYLLNVKHEVPFLVCLSDTNAVDRLIFG